MTPVLDSSVVLAKLLDEPGSDVIDAQALTSGYLSAVNMCEIITKIVERGGSEKQVEDVRSQFAARTLPFDTDQAVAAGLLRAATRSAGLSLGDRACLALARTLDAPVLTADRAWAGLDVGIEIEVIR
jgi:PIN domain nuclease of toxin-antitoxin system